MYKSWIKCFFVLVVLCVLISGSAAFAAGIPLSEALLQVGQKAGMVQISDDFSRYDSFSSDSYTPNDGKFIVLYRVGPEKEFTVSKTPFDDEFNGVDLGEVEVYLDLDKMAQIPEERRASSVDEIGNIIMFESFYMHTATISSWNAIFESKPTDRGLKAAMEGSAEEEEAEELPEQSDEHYREYKPVFTGYVAGTLYNADDGTSTFFDGEEFPIEELRKNPEAADVAELLYSLSPVYNACVDQDEENVYYTGLELLLSDQLTEEQANVLVELLSADSLDYAALEAAVVKMIWDCADQLHFLETDPKNTAMYHEVIQEKSLGGLFYVLGFCNYNNIDRSYDDLRRTKDYMGDIDRSRLEAISTETMELMEAVEWDPEILSLLLQMMEE